MADGVDDRREALLLFNVLLGAFQESRANAALALLKQQPDFDFARQACKSAPKLDPGELGKGLESEPPIDKVAGS